MLSIKPIRTETDGTLHSWLLCWRNHLRVCLPAVEEEPIPGWRRSRLWFPKLGLLQPSRMYEKWTWLRPAARRPLEEDRRKTRRERIQRQRESLAIRRSQREEEIKASLFPRSPQKPAMTTLHLGGGGLTDFVGQDMVTFPAPQKPALPVSGFCGVDCRPDGLVVLASLHLRFFSSKIPKTFVRKAANQHRAVASSSKVDLDCFGAEDPSFDPWTSLQDFSFVHWCRSLPGLCLRTRTPFAAFLRKTLHAFSGSRGAAGRSLFPLPFPKLGIFEPFSPRSSSRKRKRLEFDRAFHVVVCSLNFLHADCSFVPLDLMLKEPSDQQQTALRNLRSLLKAFGSSGGSFSVPQSGRRSIHLLAGLSDLSRFMTFHGLSSDPYHRGFAGGGDVQSPDGAMGVGVLVPDQSLAEELTPYRTLCPDRLLITGKANWDPVPFLGDVFAMPFVEPKLLKWTATYDESDIPDLQRESPDCVLGLARIWDRNGLLSLLPRRVEEEEELSCMRCFNCYKNETTDRQICDRRGRSQQEIGLPGPSRFLPTGASLAILEVNPARCFLTASASDRKDYYHQLRVPMWPPLPFRCFDGTKASSQLADDIAKGLKLSREEAGDFLGSGGKRIKKLLPKPDDLVHATFAAVPQGDHLGVEFATQSHRTLLQGDGLLDPWSELTCAAPWRGSTVLQGLVIDDFFVLSIELACVSSKAKRRGLLVPFPEPEKRCDGFPTSQRLVDVATATYSRVGLLGSPEKDILGERVAKIAGAEIDSSPLTCSRGNVVLGAPATKRMSLSLVSLVLASMPYSTDVLHACLVGGWTSCLMYRRPLMSVLFHSHTFVDAMTMDSLHPKVVPMKRRVAQELVLLGILAPLMVSDLSAPIQNRVFTSDSSGPKGAFAETVAPDDVVCVLWRTGSKKGGYARLMTKTEALARKLEVNQEPVSLNSPKPSPKKPIGLRYDFLEICGGAAKVSSQMSKLGWVVGPCLDLDKSCHFDLASGLLIRWLFHLLETGALDSFFVQPPCTTYSPAAFPALRSYAKPRGYCPTEPRTLLGTHLALNALSLLFVASRTSAIGLLEQSRRSKMAWLAEWKWLLSQGLCSEEWLASCMYNSPHQKEYMSRLHRACDRSHTHLVIQGKYTRPSATYTDELAYAFASELSRALRRKKAVDSYHLYDSSGLESPLFNDVVLGSTWKTTRVWNWKRQCHINIQESGSVLKLLQHEAEVCPKSRQSIGVDSHVALASLAKGRSPSYGLRKVTRKVGATTVAGCLYPAYHFCPTRFNPSDCPTRNVEMPSPAQSSFVFDLPVESLYELASASGLRRFASNSVRLVLLLTGGSFGWHDSSSGSWRFAHYSKKAYPYSWISSAVARASPPLPFDFDQTLGFPGEGPPRLLSSEVLSVIAVVAVGLFRLPALLCFVCFAAEAAGISKFYPLIFVGFFLRHGCLAMQPQLGPRDRQDQARASGRAAINLGQGRPVLERTKKGREKLLEGFSQWLDSRGVSFADFLNSELTDLDTVNLLLERYGRELFSAGRPYGHYSELVDGIASLRPRFRRSLQGAWDLAYSWLRHEQPCHHVALPWQPLVALLVTSFSWGWGSSLSVGALWLGSERCLQHPVQT